jgi:hypothetical protein
MPREEIDLAAGDFAAVDNFGRLAERSGDGVLGGIGQPIQLIKAASADDPDRRW